MANEVASVKRCLLVLFTASVAVLSPSPGTADCYDCQSGYDQCVADDVAGTGGYGCLVVRDNCLQACGGGSEGQAAPPIWGAIARSTETGTLGGARGFADRSSAEDAALRDCIAHENAMTGCQVVVYFHDACGAVAAATDGSWGSDWGHDAAEAAAKASPTCMDYGGTDCAVVASLCSN